MDSPNYRIFVNGQLFTVDLPTLVPAQIRALAGIPPGHLVVCESAGAAADRLLAEGDCVSLEGGPVNVYSMPPAVHG